MLYVDDDAEKGWHEILIKILSDINSIEYFDYLGDEIKKISKEEIIQKTLNKVHQDDIDIVILDFRLHPDDFINKDIEEITGFKLLKGIKSINPGIQVIFFSATSKIWNFQALELAGANGFIVKESPIHTSASFTANSIKGFVRTVESCCHIIFLKQFFKCQFEVESELTPRKKKTNDKPLPKYFVDETIKWLRLSNVILTTGDLSETKITTSFLFKFSVLENLTNRIIDVDNPILIKKNEHGIKRYHFQFRTTNKLLCNFREDKKQN